MRNAVMSFKLWSTRSGQTTGIGTLLLFSVQTVATVYSLTAPIKTPLTKYRCKNG